MLQKNIYTTIKDIYLSDIEKLLTHNNHVFYLNTLLKTNNIVITVEKDTSLPIDYLDLSIRSYNCLRRSGIRSIKKLYQINDLSVIRNLGKKCIKEINDKLEKLQKKYGYLKDEPFKVYYTYNGNKYELTYKYGEVSQISKSIFDDLFDYKKAGLFDIEEYSSELIIYLTLIKGYYYRKDIYNNIDTLLLELANNPLKEELLAFKKHYEEKNWTKSFYITDMLDKIEPQIIYNFINKYKLKSIENELLNNNELLVKFLVFADYNHQYFNECYLELIEEIYENNLYHKTKNSINSKEALNKYIQYMNDYIKILIDKKNFHLSQRLLVSIHMHGLCIPESRYVVKLLEIWYQLWERLLDECRDDTVINHMKDYVIDQLHFVGTQKEAYNIELFLKYFNDKKTITKKQLELQYRLDGILLSEKIPDEIHTFLYLGYKLDMDINKLYEEFKNISFIKIREENS